MKVEALAAGSFGPVHKFEPVERLDQERKAAQDSPDTQKVATKISSEELFDKIKELSEDGLYSVRFEMNKEIDSLVIRVVDRENGELIRQIPSDELISVSKNLKDLRGLVVKTES